MARETDSTTAAPVGKLTEALTTEERETLRALLAIEAEYADLGGWGAYFMDEVVADSSTLGRRQTKKSLLRLRDKGLLETTVVDWREQPSGLRPGAMRRQTLKFRIPQTGTGRRVAEKLKDENPRATNPGSPTDLLRSLKF